MENHQFSIGEVIGYGFRIFIDHVFLLTGAVLIAATTYILAKLAWVFFLGMVVFSSNSTAIIDTFAWGNIDIAVFASLPPLFYVLYVLGSFALLFVYYGLMAGMIQLIFTIHDKNTGTIGDIFTRFYLAPYLWITSIVYYLIVIGGLILLVIPGIYWGIRFSLYPYFIVDKETGIMTSLRNSYAVTTHHTLKLFVLFALLFFINFIPLVGSVIAGLITPLILVYVYRTLTAHPPATLPL